MHVKIKVFACLLLLFNSCVFAEDEIHDKEAILACIVERINEASNDVPIGYIKKKCRR